MVACRKAAATAFSTANMRKQFPNIRLACSQLIDMLKTVGPNEVVDMDNALCRESLDVIGKTCSRPASLTQPFDDNTRLVFLVANEKLVDSGEQCPALRVTLSASLGAIPVFCVALASP